jgi:hypothetical protein
MPFKSLNLHGIFLSVEKIPLSILMIFNDLCVNINNK